MASASSLLKSAAGIRDQLATYQDSVQAFEYSNSAYTDSALNDYQSYLKSRIDALNKSGSISDASKALSLTKSLDSAIKSNVSATITRENIDMMAGNASLTDKYNVIVGQYSRATANGDLTLAQSLMSQAYSTSQSIQLQAQAAADAAKTLASAQEAAAKQGAANEGNIADGLTESLKQLNNDIKLGGNLDKTVKAWTSQNSTVLQSLGVKLPNQPNYWDIVSGIAGAQYNHHMLSAQQYAPYGTGPGSQAWVQAGKASDINSGVTSLPTLGGSLSLQQIMQASADPNQFVFNPSKGSFVQTQQTGFTQQFDRSNPGQAPTLTPTYSGTVAHTVVLSPTETAQMTKLGLNFGASTKGTASDGVQVQATDKTPVWLQQVLGKNGVTNVYSSDLGLQFNYASKDGTGNSVYTVVSDGQGHLGLFEQGQTSEGYLHGEYGFNPSGITSGSTSHQSMIGRIMGDVSTLLNGHASADSFSGSSYLANATGHFTPPPIAIAPPANLPSISLPPPPSMPSIQINHSPTPQPAVPRTVSVQGASPVIQGGSSSAVQNAGGGSINNSGGKGIAFTGITNGPVGMRF